MVSAGDRLQSLEIRCCDAYSYVTVTRSDREKLQECKGLLSKGQWKAASRLLEDVTQAGQSTLEYEVQVCAVLQAAGLDGQIREVAQRLDR